MNIKDLKVGDKVFIREDLEHGACYGSYMYINTMGSGIKQIKYICIDGGFSVVCGKGALYTSEMVDWEKTAKLNNLSCFKEITQSGENGNETTKAVRHDGKETIVKNNNEKNDVEKAVMLLMLKSLGITYSEIKKEVEKVKIKWVPQLGEKYYWINKYLEVDWYVWEGHSVDKMLFMRDNCFETRKDAEEKLEKIKEVLKGE